MTTTRLLDAAIFAQSRLDEPLPLARLAAAARMSPYHFHREFTRASGETPVDTLRSVSTTDLYLPLRNTVAA